MSRLLMIWLVGATSWACTCGGRFETAKEAWQNRRYVFTGTIIETIGEKHAATTSDSRVVRIRVDEPFKGVTAGQVIELPHGPSWFRVGQRFVFYPKLNNKGQFFYLEVCTTSYGSADPDGDDMLFLRGLPASAKSTRLSGNVAPYLLGGDDAAGIAGVPISIVSLTTGKVVRTLKTNRAGVFEVYGLPAGRYAIRMKPVDGYLLHSIDGQTRPLELKRDGSASIDLSLKLDTRVAGRVLDSEGKPLDGVCVDLIPAVVKPDANERRDFSCSKPGSGMFVIDGMPPGTYLLRATLEARNDGGEAKSTLYYSASRSRRDARVLEVKVGKAVEGIEFRLRSKEEATYRIRGRLSYADGKPAAKAIVTFAAPEDDDYLVTANTLPDGSFALDIAAEFHGTLSGRIMVFEPILAKCPQFQPIPKRGNGVIRFLETSKLPIIAGQSMDGVELRFSSPSCEAFR